LKGAAAVQFCIIWLPHHGFVAMSGTNSYGDLAISLIKELDLSRREISSSINNINSNNNNSLLLPPYQLHKIESITKECAELFSSLYATKLLLSANPANHSAAISLTVELSTLAHNKRCVLAYLNYRQEKLREFYWNYGPILPDNYKNNLSKQEIEYFDNYCSVCREMDNNVELDLSSDLHPPKSLYLQCRVLQDLGAISTEAGPVNLTKNSQHSMKRIDADRYIRQGILLLIE
jgi:GINS complex subunit 1